MYKVLDLLVYFNVVIKRGIQAIRDHQKRIESHKQKRWLKKRTTKIKPSENSTTSKHQDEKFLYGIHEDNRLNAPSDFRIIGEGMEKCLFFFRIVREAALQNKRVNLSLKDVTKIDYGAISILAAISSELKDKQVILAITPPTNSTCMDTIRRSGFLEHMFDHKGNSFKKEERSGKMIFVKKGEKKITGDTMDGITMKIEEVIKKQPHRLKISAIISELTGNSVEWGNAKNDQWLLGISAHENSIIFTMTDVGMGIITRLKEQHKKKLINLKNLIKHHNPQLLCEIFERKIELASTQESNRNKGLPFVAKIFDEEVISKLTVITNNVLLQFENKNKKGQRISSEGSFKGTFYYWEYIVNNHLS